MILGERDALGVRVNVILVRLDLGTAVVSRRSVYARAFEQPETLPASSLAVAL